MLNDSIFKKPQGFFLNNISSYLISAQGGLVGDVSGDPPGFGLFSPEDSGVIAAVEVEEEEDGGDGEDEAANYLCTGTGTFASTRNCRDYFTCTPDGVVCFVVTDAVKYCFFLTARSEPFINLFIFKLFSHLFRAPTSLNLLFPFQYIALFFFKAFKFSCPSGLFYDPSIGACNWPEAVSCPLVPVPTLYKDEVCGRLQDGLYSDPYTRNQFFWCLASRRVQLSCPYGLVFDSLTGQCNSFLYAR